MAESVERLQQIMEFCTAVLVQEDLTIPLANVILNTELAFPELTQFCASLLAQNAEYSHFCQAFLTSIRNDSATFRWTTPELLSFTKQLFDHENIAAKVACALYLVLLEHNEITSPLSILLNDNEKCENVDENRNFFKYVVTVLLLVAYETNDLNIIEEGLKEKKYTWFFQKSPNWKAFEMPDMSNIKTGVDFFRSFVRPHDVEKNVKDNISVNYNRISLEPTFDLMKISKELTENDMMAEALFDTIDLAAKAFPYPLATIFFWITKNDNSEENKAFCQCIIKCLFDDTDIEPNPEMSELFKSIYGNNTLSAGFAEIATSLSGKFPDLTASLLPFLNDAACSPDPQVWQNFISSFLIQFKLSYSMSEQTTDFKADDGEQSSKLYEFCKLLTEESEELATILFAALAEIEKKFTKTLYYLVKLLFGKIDSLPFSSERIVFAKTLVELLLSSEKDEETEEEFYTFANKYITEREDFAWRLAAVLFKISKRFPEIYLEFYEKVTQTLFRPTACEMFKMAISYIFEKVVPLDESEEQHPDFPVVSEKLYTESIETTNSENKQLELNVDSDFKSPERKKTKANSNPEKIEKSKPTKTTITLNNAILVSKELHYSHHVGKGAFGIVDAFQDSNNGKMYAIKQIPCPPMPQNEMEAYLKEKMKPYLREAALLTLLDSKGLFTECVRTFVNFDAWRSPDSSNYRFNFCIQMPLYDMNVGQLADKVRALPGRLFFSLWFVSVIMQEVFEAVEILHDNDLVHRDLKPANVLISLQGSRSMVKLGDFGTVQTLELPPGDILKAGTSSAPDSTVPGHDLSEMQRGGTAHYRAPNTLQKGAFGFKDDVYSLGMLYARLAKSTFYESDRNFVLEKAISFEMGITFWSRHKLYHFSLGRLIDKMINSLPEKRPSIKEVKEMNTFVSGYLASDHVNDSFPNIYSRYDSFLDVFFDPLFKGQNHQLKTHYKKVNIFGFFLNTTVVVLISIIIIFLQLFSSRSTGTPLYQSIVGLHLSKLRSEDLDFKENVN